MSNLTALAQRQKSRMGSLQAERAGADGPGRSCQPAAGRAAPGGGWSAPGDRWRPGCLQGQRMGAAPLFVLSDAASHSSSSLTPFWHGC